MLKGIMRYICSEDIADWFTIYHLLFMLFSSINHRIIKFPFIASSRGQFFCLVNLVNYYFIYLSDHFANSTCITLVICASYCFNPNIMTHTRAHIDTHKPQIFNSRSSFNLNDNNYNVAKRRQDHNYIFGIKL